MYILMLNLQMQNPLESIGRSPKRKLKNNNFNKFWKNEEVQDDVHNNLESGVFIYQRRFCFSVIYTTSYNVVG